MTDLNKKQTFWAEQLPAFKENYICLAQLDAVVFNNETGNFDALDKDATGFDREDILEAYHSVNTGWAMWLRAKSQEKAKAQAVPDTHLLIPKEPNRKTIMAMACVCLGPVGSGPEFLTLKEAKDVYSALVEKETGAEG